MKRFLACLLAGTALATTGCDTEQPTQRPNANVIVQLGVTVDTYGLAVYDRIVSGQTTYRLACGTFVPAGSAEPFRLGVRKGAWPLAVEISVIPSGSTTPQVIATTTGLAIPGTIGEFNTRTEYDTEPMPPGLPTVPPKAPEGGVTFANGRVLSAGYREMYLKCGSAPGIPEVPPVGFPFDEYGPVQIVQQTIGSPTYALELSKGDTVVVKARKVDDPGFPVVIGILAQVTASVFIDGSMTAVAQESSATSSGAGVVLTYTLP